MEPIPEWQERLDAMADAYNRKREAERAQRTELSRRRWFGLKARHAAKLARRPPDKP
jgi:hypothetical protein